MVPIYILFLQTNTSHRYLTDLSYFWRRQIQRDKTVVLTSVISFISYSGKIVCSTWRGSQKRRGSKTDPGGVTAQLLTNPWLIVLLKIGVFFPGFWLWFTETVRPIKKIQNIWFNGQCFRTTYLLVSLTRISPTPYFFFYSFWLSFHDAFIIEWRNSM